MVDPDQRCTPTLRRKSRRQIRLFAADGVAINSGQYNRLSDARVQTPHHRRSGQSRASAVGAVNYKLRDWLFSRQRFWGEPFPILHELDADGKPNGLLRAVPVEQLPVDLPHLADYKPPGEPKPPLEKAPAEWLYPVIDGKKYKRETNTMPQWAGSCWYYLRFLDQQKRQSARSIRQIEKAWMPVDLYIGGAEHAVLHLLYSRFWHKVLFDRGYREHARAVHEAGEPGHDPGRDGIHRLSQNRRGLAQRRRREVRRRQQTAR